MIGFFGETTLEILKNSFNINYMGTLFKTKTHTRNDGNLWPWYEENAREFVARWSSGMILVTMTYMFWDPLTCFGKNMTYMFMVGNLHVYGFSG